MRQQQHIKVMPVKKQNEFTVVALNFSNSEVPEFKQNPGDKYVKFGKEDKYPEYLLGLYDKSAKHEAIINGKVNYILGGGFEVDVEDPKAEDFKKAITKVAKESILDVEVFGGFYWEIIPTQFEGVFGIYHVSFKNIRSNKEGTEFYYKSDWDKSNYSEIIKNYPAFNRNLRVPSIFSFKEYRPGKKVYALPGYLASCNYIESDIEVSKHTLTNAKTGFSGSKFINFYNGEPTEEQKGEIVRRFTGNYTGGEGKKIVFGFNNPETTAPTIEDLGTSDLTKEDFSHVNNLITQEIFAGAQITHPLLFGIQQEGKLGGATELRTAFDIFKNTYVNGKQLQFEEIVNFFASLKGITAKFKLKDIDPIGFEFTEATMLAVAPRSWLLEKMGIDPALYPDAPASGIAAPAVNAEGLAASGTNDNVKNLSAKQHQQLQRIIRQFGKGQLTKEAATILLKSGLGFSDSEVAGILGLDTEQAFSSDDDIELLFQVHGEDKDTYETIKSKAATFDSEDDDFINTATFDREAAIDEQTKLRPPVSAKAPPAKIKLPEFKIMYSYEVREGEGPELLPTSRSFCVKMVAFSKFYTRSDIQKISGLLGYNVFDRVGGFWNDNGIIKKHCRHEWRASVVVKK